MSDCTYSVLMNVCTYVHLSSMYPPTHTHIHTHRLATGSFDQRVKIWSTDGKVMCAIACIASITGICYVPDTRVLWVAAGTAVPVLYEPKTGDNVRTYIHTYVCESMLGRECPHPSARIRMYIHVCVCVQTYVRA